MKITRMCTFGTLFINVLCWSRLPENGSGVAKDVNKAKEWYAKGAAQGNTPAQTQLDLLNAA